MERYNKPTDKKSIQWTPEEPLRKVLRESILNQIEDGRFIEEYVEIYKTFREPQPDETLSFPVLPVKVSDLYDDLFSPMGSVKQMNLDNIGKDFLCYILLTQFLREHIEEGGVETIVRFLTDDRRMSNENNNLNNSILRVEVLFNYLRTQGIDLSLDVNLTDRQEFVLFTDAPLRKLKNEEINPLEWIVGTSMFSKLIRKESVLFQNRERFESILPKISHESFGLPLMVRYLNGVERGPTLTESLRITLNREFRLWDPFRRLGYPNLRDISDGTGIPYILLLGLRDRSGNPTQYTGTDLLHRVPTKIYGELSREFLLRSYLSLQ